MIIIHIISSAKVGGRTGKSTFCYMLASYLCRSEAPARTVAILDLSVNTPTHDRFKTLLGFNQQSSTRKKITRAVAGYPCYVRSNEDNKHLAILSPNVSHVPTWGQQTSMISKIVQDYPRHFGSPINHFIVETNLPSDNQEAQRFLAKLHENGDGVNLRIWTTWVTDRLTDKNTYNRITQQGYVGRDQSVEWYYIHNPYAAIDAPELDISPSMERCFGLGLDGRISSENLWKYCGEPAGKIRNASSEKIWEGSYDYFFRQNTRPVNLLPVFMKSKIWVDNVRDNIDSYGTVENPAQLADRIEQLSAGMYSKVFEPYFRKIAL